MEYSGSSYDGETREGRMEGKGTYFFPVSIQTAYIGEMKDGRFHGNGSLHFSNGSKYEGVWEKGKSIEGKYILEDGLAYDSEDWQYCNPSDRRFYTEMQKSLQPAGRSQLTNAIPPPTIPEDCYDCGDGSYDPIAKNVKNYKTGKFIRNTDQMEHEWILKRCRKGWDENVGCQNNKEIGLQTENHFFNQNCNPSQNESMKL